MVNETGEVLCNIKTEIDISFITLLGNGLYFTKSDFNLNSFIIF